VRRVREHNSSRCMVVPSLYVITQIFRGQRFRIKSGIKTGDHKEKSLVAIANEAGDRRSLYWDTSAFMMTLHCRFAWWYAQRKVMQVLQERKRINIATKR